MRKLIGDALRAGHEAVAAHARRIETPGATALLCLGGSASNPERLIKALDARAVELGGWRALLIVDVRGAPDFVAPGRLIECLPVTDHLRRATDCDAGSAIHYRRRRLTMVLAKWRVRECAPIGEEAEALLAPLSELTQIRRLPV
ncbi:MAG: hypothetical protein AAGB18_00105 [Pseudomonadota bacterium]